ncbi:DUF916 domain-containing protein, partial [Candidatus Peregrinibacteria bacterium]|nr:DUF916 domain-containing protein [Candidatus Peregrinibacteria bacterium]
EAGEVQDEGILVINNSSTTKTMMVYATDSTASTGGAFACEQKSQERDGVGAWIELEKAEVTVPAGSNEMVPFTITVPDKVSVGEHNGCLVIQEKIEEENTSAGVHLSMRSALRVAVTIPGEIIKELNVVEFETGERDGIGKIVHLAIQNSGNVSVDTDIRILTKNLFGSTYQEDGGTYPVLRDDTLEWDFEVQKPFWGGVYTSVYSVNYQGADLGSDEVRFFMFPSLLGFIIELSVFAVFAALVAFLLYKRKRARWIQNNWVEVTLPQGFDIKSLAAKTGVSWKLIAKVNNLKPPYAISANDKVKLPPKKKQ